MKINVKLIDLMQSIIINIIYIEEKKIKVFIIC